MERRYNARKRQRKTFYALLCLLNGVSAPFETRNNVLFALLLIFKDII